MPRNDPIQRKLDLLDERLDEMSSPHNLIFSKYPLLLPAVGFIIGIILQDILSLPFWLYLTILSAATAFAIIYHFTKRQNPDLKPLAYSACIAFAAFGALRYTAINHPAANDVSNIVTDTKVLATIKGRLTTEPRKDKTDDWHFGRYLSMWSKPSASFYLQVDKGKTEAGFTDMTGTIRVQASGNITHIAAGDYVQIDCWLSRFSPPKNPGQFNVAKYLSQKGVFVAASVNSPGGIELVRGGDSNGFVRVKNKLKTIATEALLGGVSPDEQSSGVLAALLLGQRGDIDSETYNAFRQTGLLHFISLSGMHLGILAGIIWWLCKTAGLPKSGRAAICIILIGL